MHACMHAHTYISVYPLVPLPHIYHQVNFFLPLQCFVNKSSLSNLTKLLLLDSVIDLYNLACHLTTTDQIVMKFWILPFQWHRLILFFWSQAHRPPELVGIVLWKWLFWAILQRKVVKTSNLVSTMGPGFNLTFFGAKGLVFMWKEWLHQKIPSLSNFLFVHKTTFYTHFPGRYLPYYTGVRG